MVDVEENSLPGRASKSTIRENSDSNLENEFDERHPLLSWSSHYGILGLLLMLFSFTLLIVSTTILVFWLHHFRGGFDLIDYLTSHYSQRQMVYRINVHGLETSVAFTVFIIGSQLVHCFFGFFSLDRNLQYFVKAVSLSTAGVLFGLGMYEVFAKKFSLPNVDNSIHRFIGYTTVFFCFGFIGQQLGSILVFVKNDTSHQRMENKLIQKLEKILANHFVQENVESITFALFIFSILTGIFNYALQISSPSNISESSETHTFLVLDSELDSFNLTVRRLFPSFDPDDSSQEVFYFVLMIGFLIFQYILTNTVEVFYHHFAFDEKNIPVKVYRRRFRELVSSIETSENEDQIKEKLCEFYQDDKREDSSLEIIQNLANRN